MNKLFLLLMLTLLIASAFGSPARAGIVPGLDGPTLGGSGGADGDHPWGGDQTPTDVTVTTAVYTGILPVDLLVRALIKTDVTIDCSASYRRVVSTSATATVSRRTSVSAASSSSFSGRKALK